MTTPVKVAIGVVGFVVLLNIVSSDDPDSSAPAQQPSIKLRVAVYDDTSKKPLPRRSEI